MGPCFSHIMSTVLTGFGFCDFNYYSKHDVLACQSVEYCQTANLEKGFLQSLLFTVRLTKEGIKTEKKKQKLKTEYMQSEQASG